MHTTDHIRYLFLKTLVFVTNCFAFYVYCILIFVLFCKVRNIFLFLTIKESNEILALIGITLKKEPYKNLSIIQIS